MGWLHRNKIHKEEAPQYTIESGVCSDVGRRRTNNEDNYWMIDVFNEDMEDHREEGIMDIAFPQFDHLLSCGGITGCVDGDSAGKGDDPADAFLYVVIPVVAGLDSLHCGITQVKGPVFPVDKAFSPGDNLAVFIPVFDFMDAIVVIMPVGDQDQIRWNVISVAGVGIDIDDFSFRGGDPEACVALIIQRMTA